MLDEISARIFPEKKFPEGPLTLAMLIQKCIAFIFEPVAADYTVQLGENDNVLLRDLSRRRHCHNIFSLLFVGLFGEKMQSDVDALARAG